MPAPASSSVQDRYERLRTILPMDAITSAFAIVGGVGALGNEVAKNLALLGVGHVLICDLDDVEIHNLTRSVLFRREDTGRPKAEVAAEHMLDLNPDINVIPFPRNIAELGLGFYRRADMIFTTFDVLFPRFVVNEACMRTGRPWVDGGMSAINHARGGVTVYNGRDRDAFCYCCSLNPNDVLNYMSQARGARSCQVYESTLTEQGGVPTTPMTSSVIAGIQVSAALDVFGCRLRSEESTTWSIGSFEIDMASLSSRKIRKKRRSPCYHHDLVAAEPLEEILTECPEWRSDRTTAADVLKRAAADLGTTRVTIQLPEVVVTSGTCDECGEPWELFMLLSSYRQARAHLLCPSCGSGAFVPDFGTGEVAEIGGDHSFIERPVGEIGLRLLDIVTVVASDEMGLPTDVIHYELSGDVERLGIGLLTGCLRG